MLNELPYHAVIELCLRYWERQPLSSNLELEQSVVSFVGFERHPDRGLGRARVTAKVGWGKTVTATVR